MTATLNVVVSINSTTVMQTYWSAPSSKLASASPTLCLADGAARAKGGRTLRHSRPGLQNYSVGRFLRFLLSFTACPSPTLCLADGAARAKGGRTLRHSRPGLHIKLLCWTFFKVFAFLYGLSLTHLLLHQSAGF